MTHQPTKILKNKKLYATPKNPGKSERGVSEGQLPVGLNKSSRYVSAALIFNDDQFLMTKFLFVLVAKLAEIHVPLGS
jgi:hypothetical protein